MTVTGQQSHRIDMTGRRFGMWTVVSYANKKKWLCRCECGEQRSVLGASLRNGASTSCGCTRMESMADAKRTHGRYLSPIYKIWTQMIQRCHNPNSTAYHDYGARGIAVCDRWRESFENFLADVGERPSATMSIDRIDNLKGYEPGNVRWSTVHQQLNNRRNTRRFTVCGETLTLVELTEKYNIKRATVEKRLRLGWSIEKAIFTPIQQPRAS